ncbi:MAG: hypothetical protein L6Q71_09850, partial [Planctomycetes bacterium]|nr:hypothetical protein [Planctomycetota bacterium]
MRVMMALMLLLALTGMTAAQDKPAGTSPDKTTPAPIEFRDSPVEELLNWARKRTGCGFIFDADHLLDEGKKPLKVSYTPATEGGEQDDILVLFECLKRVGLVAMEVQGLEDITYHILPVNEAIGYADVAWEFEQLEGLYFGTLRVEARTIAIDKIEAIARKFLSRHGQITALPETSIL